MKKMTNFENGQLFGSSFGFGILLFCGAKCSFHVGRQETGYRRQETTHASPLPLPGVQGCFILNRHGDAPDTPDTGMEAFKRR